MEAILHLYQPSDPKRPLICFDEKMTQLLGDVRVPLPLKAKSTRRQDYEYKRNGTNHIPGYRRDPCLPPRL